MLKIGLTGGIGSGKSTVCRIFASLGIKIIDADIIARQLVEPNQPALQQLVAKFGCRILNADGDLNRALLREIIFSDSGKKQAIEEIMHPLIYSQIKTEIEHVDSDYCIIAIPLLLETQQKDIVDRVLLVDCSPEIQLERTIQRDNVSSTQVNSIIASQMTRQQRILLADDIIDNSSSTLQLAEQIKKLHNSYILLATVRTSSA